MGSCKSAVIVFFRPHWDNRPITRICLACARAKVMKVCHSRNCRLCTRITARRVGASGGLESRLAGLMGIQIRHVNAY
jgi:hypothetical protein